MTEQIANLREWHAALGQPAGVLMSYVVPAQIDPVKGFTALERQATTTLGLTSEGLSFVTPPSAS